VVLGLSQDYDAFYTLDTNGELQPLEYAKHIAASRILWD
jgi:hypothetical protein